LHCRLCRGIDGEIDNATGLYYCPWLWHLFEDAAWRQRANIRRIDHNGFEAELVKNVNSIFIGFVIDIGHGNLLAMMGVEIKSIMYSQHQEHYYHHHSEEVEP